MWNSNMLQGHNGYPPASMAARSMMGVGWLQRDMNRRFQLSSCACIYSTVMSVYAAQLVRLLLSDWAEVAEPRSAHRQLPQTARHARQ